MRLIASVIVAAAIYAAPAYAQTAPTAPSSETTPQAVPSEAAPKVAAPKADTFLVKSPDDFSALMNKMIAAGCKATIDYQGADASIKVITIVCDKPGQLDEHATIGEKLFNDNSANNLVGGKYTYHISRKKS